MGIQAIETKYAGCRFRSRLEARWAVFFDAFGVKWQYEPEGFSIEAPWFKTRYYLPDFYLPELGVWVEVKGDRENFTTEYAWMLRVACDEVPHSLPNPKNVRAPLLVLGQIPSARTCDTGWPLHASFNFSLGFHEFAAWVPSAMLGVCGSDGRAWWLEDNRPEFPPEVLYRSSSQTSVETCWSGNYGEAEDIHRTLRDCLASTLDSDQFAPTGPGEDIPSDLWHAYEEARCARFDN